MMKTRMWRRASAVAVAALALAACVDSPATSVLAPSDAFMGGIPPLDPTKPAPVPDRAVERERLEVCKDYAAGSVAPAQTDFKVDVTGGVTTSFTISLAPGECKEVWVNGASNAVDNLTVTEMVPVGFTSAWTKTVLDKTSGPTNSAGSGNVASNDIGGPPLTGALIIFTNTPIPDEEEPGVGRFTGGGWQTVNGEKIKIAFTIHCDITLSNNIEINWGKNKWHIDKPITKALCLLDPNYNHPPPVAPLNTFIGEATGRLNNVDGSKIWFTIIDDGEPGKNDMFALKIVDAGGATVLDIPLAKIEGGNFQAHYDQPHGNKPSK